MLDKAPQVNDVAAAEAKAEGQKLEWGPELGKMSWNDAQVKIAELNAGLAEGEKPWRLPTKDELVAEFNKTRSTPAGLQRESYWSGTTYPDGLGYAYGVSMGSGDVNYGYKEDRGSLVRLVRDAA